MQRASQPTVSVVLTLKNDPVGCEETLRSLVGQSRPADEIVVVDGGSSDDTVARARAWAAGLPGLRVIEAPGANIARGRNLGIQAARGEIIASIDGGCVARPDWLEQLVAPLLAEEPVEFVAGFYDVAGRTLLERVIGLATMRGQLEAIDARTFNPSARSMAFTRELWRRAGGWPEWVGFSEDTLFDHKVRRLGAAWRFVPEAVVSWRPRTGLRAAARQFYHYGTGRGQTQIDAAGYLYNVRNLACVLGLALAGFVIFHAAIAAALLGAYWFVWGHRDKARHVAARLGVRRAALLYVVVMWVVTFAGTAGYVVGSGQRLRDRARFRGQMEAYLGG
ncbi:MAG: glycosyltransferase [Planctomycetes bacterium]|nr:glycosyltransferase [Planctomycetota bacterium]